MKKISLFTLLLPLLFTPYSKNLVAYQQEEELSSLRKDISAIEKNLFGLVNKEREKLGFPALKYSPDLSTLARKHSQDMADRQKLSHLSSAGKSYTQRLVDAEFYLISAGENVAFSETFVPEIIHQSFMASPGHKKNIFEPTYDQVGIGVISVEEKGYYITQDFLQSLEPMEEEGAKTTLQVNINRLRRRNSIPPLVFLKEQAEYAQEYSLKKAEGKLPPPVPRYFGRNYIIHISSPSLHEAQSGLKDEALNNIHESAALGIVFRRNSQYPGGAYFVTLILLVEHKHKSWSNEKLKETVLLSINNIRQKKGKREFKPDEKLTKKAEEIVKTMIAQRGHSPMALPGFQKTAIFSYITEDPTMLPKNIRNKIENDLLRHTHIGVGILFAKNQNFPRGAFWVYLIIEE